MALLLGALAQDVGISADVALTNALFSRRSRLAACSSADDGLGD
jgi:hypothetical protein